MKRKWFLSLFIIMFFPGLVAQESPEFPVDDEPGQEEQTYLVSPHDAVAEHEDIVVKIDGVIWDG
jgi:hypothetical protein